MLRSESALQAMMMHQGSCTSPLHAPLGHAAGKHSWVSYKGLYQKSKTLSAFLRERLALIEDAGARRVAVNSLARRLKVGQQPWRGEMAKTHTCFPFKASGPGHGDCVDVQSTSPYIHLCVQVNEALIIIVLSTPTLLVAWAWDPSYYYSEFRTIRSCDMLPGTASTWSPMVVGLELKSPWVGTYLSFWIYNYIAVLSIMNNL